MGTKLCQLQLARGYPKYISIGQNVFLKATVSPSQPGVGRADYSACILIVPVGDNGYRINNASCTCPAGFRESM